MSEEQTTETEIESTESTTEETTTTETQAAAGESASGEETTTETTSNETEVTTESTGDETQQKTTAESDEGQVERVVPEADGYKLPEGVPIQVAQFAQQNDMTQEQLDGALGYFGNYLKATTDSQEKFLADAGAKHVETWGDQKEYNLSLVRRALAQNDPDGSLKEMLNSTGYGNHPAVIDFFLKVGTSMKEGGFIQGSVHTPTGKKTAAQTLFGNSHPSVNN